MIIAFILIVIHYIADFICQDEEWAVGKSKSLRMLLYHTLTYSCVWILPMWYLVGTTDALLFAFITFLIHTQQDFWTSKITSNLYANGKFGSSIPNLGFFSMIGFDQVLHYAQLFLTYYFITDIL